MLRVGRFTRHLPWFRGMGVLRDLYRRILPDDSRFRIDDFDNDLTLDVNVRETIGVNLWHAPGLYEKRERDLFCSAIRPGAIVLDVGANIGIYTLLAAKRGAQVYAIEADKDNLRALRHHVEINGFRDRVAVFEMAAVESERLVTLYRNEANSGGSTLFGTGQGITVQGRTIDSLELPPVDVCKIDIEGAELLALRGMKRTLSRSPKLKLLVEFSQRGESCRDLLTLLQEEFLSLSVVGGAQVASSTPVPSYCNLWACRDECRMIPS